MAGRPRTVHDDAILDAVRDVVSAAGPAGLTLGAVAERVGLTAPALARRFGSKQGLLVAFAARAATGVRAELAAVADASRRDGTGELGALRAVVRALVGTVSTRVALANHLAMLCADLGDDVLRGHAAEHRRGVVGVVTELVGAAVAAGEMDAAVDPDRFAETVVAVVDGARIGWAVDGTGPIEEWVAERVDGILTPHLAPG